MVTGFSSLWSHFMGLIWELIPSLWTMLIYVSLFCFIQLSFKNGQSHWCYFFILAILIFLSCENIKEKCHFFFLKYLIFISYLLMSFWLLFPEPTVRTELMEQIPPIAIFLQESRPKFPTAFFEYLMPIVVRYLTDVNNQVWKTDNRSWILGKLCVVEWI